MVNAGGARSTSLRSGTMRRYKRSSKSVKDLVAKAVSRNQEKKESNVFAQNRNLYGSVNASWAASSIQLSPGTSPNGFSIPNGTGQGNRIGNRIRVEKAWVKGIIFPMPTNEVTNPSPVPLQIRMLIFKDKYRATAQPAAINLDLFQTGSTSIGPADNLVDMILDINRDRYQIYHDSVMKLGFAENAGTGGVVAQQYRTNNDFSYNCEFNIDITNFLPKNIVFNDAEVNPMSDGLWMQFLVVPANGTVAGNNAIFAQLHYSANIEYSDA